METPEEREARLDRALKRLGLEHLKDHPEELKEAIPREMWKRLQTHLKAQKQAPPQAGTVQPPQVAVGRKRHLRLVPPLPREDPPPAAGSA